MLFNGAVLSSYTRNHVMCVFMEINRALTLYNSFS